MGLGDASDAEVWQYASANEFVLISKDEDFMHISSDPKMPAAQCQAV